jgi:hypothetical protein
VLVDVRESPAKTRKSSCHSQREKNHAPTTASSDKVSASPAPPAYVRGSFQSIEARTYETVQRLCQRRPGPCLCEGAVPAATTTQTSAGSGRERRHVWPALAGPFLATPTEMWGFVMRSCGAVDFVIFTYIDRRKELGGERVLDGRENICGLVVGCRKRCLTRTEVCVMRPKGEVQCRSASAADPFLFVISPREEYGIVTGTSIYVELYRA